MRDLRKGSRVIHRALGVGTVKALRYNGHEAYVSFGRFTLWVPTKELEVTGEGLRLIKRDDPAPQGEGRGQRLVDEMLAILKGQERPKSESQRRLPPPTYSPPLAGRPIQDAKDIEALRLGVVPISRIEEWTVGREEEVKRIIEFISDDAEGALAIEGAYGAGKTHLVTYAYHRTLKEGFAVAAAGFGSSQKAAAFPKRTYRNIVAGFAAPLEGRIVGFRDFLRSVASKGAWRDVLGDHWALAPLLRRIEREEVSEDDWAWIEGREVASPHLPTLHDHGTCANLYCNLLSAIGRAAAEVLNLRGFVVLLDEAEVARSVPYSYHLARGLNFFRGLILTANDEEALLEEEVVKGDVFYAGSITRLLYSGFRPVRYTAGVPSYLKVIFAVTPGSLRQELKKYRDSMEFIEVDPLPPSDLRRLFGLICDRFATVYGVRLTMREREEVYRLLAYGDGRVSSTREFIKASVEALDGLRFFPNVPLSEVLSDSGA